MQMETFTRVSGKMAKLTVSESSSIKTVACMKAVGKMTCSMGTDARAGTTGKFNSTENFEKERKQDLEDLNSKVDTMKVTSLTVNSTGTANTSSKSQESYMKENSRITTFTGTA